VTDAVDGVLAMPSEDIPESESCCWATETDLGFENEIGLRDILYLSINGGMGGAGQMGFL
jgi:hypothetical protein